MLKVTNAHSWTEKTVIRMHHMTACVLKLTHAGYCRLKKIAT